MATKTKQTKQVNGKKLIFESKEDDEAQIWISGAIQGLFTDATDFYSYLDSVLSDYENGLDEDTISILTDVRSDLAVIVGKLLSCTAENVATDPADKSNVEQGQQEAQDTYSENSPSETEPTPARENKIKHTPRKKSLKESVRATRGINIDSYQDLLNYFDSVEDYEELIDRNSTRYVDVDDIRCTHEFLRWFRDYFDTSVCDRFFSQLEEYQQKGRESRYIDRLPNLVCDIEEVAENYYGIDVNGDECSLDYATQYDRFLDLGEDDRERQRKFMVDRYSSYGDPYYESLDEGKKKRKKRNYKGSFTGIPSKVNTAHPHKCGECGGKETPSEPTPSAESGETGVSGAVNESANSSTHTESDIFNLIRTAFPHISIKDYNSKWYTPLKNYLEKGGDIEKAYSLAKSACDKKDEKIYLNGLKESLGSRNRKGPALSEKYKHKTKKRSKALENFLFDKHKTKTSVKESKKGSSSTTISHKPHFITESEEKPTLTLTQEAIKKLEDNGWNVEYGGDNQISFNTYSDHGEDIEEIFELTSDLVTNAYDRYDDFDVDEEIDILKDYKNSDSFLKSMSWRDIVEAEEEHESLLEELADILYELYKAGKLFNTQGKTKTIYSCYAGDDTENHFLDYFDTQEEAEEYAESHPNIKTIEKETYYLDDEGGVDFDNKTDDGSVVVWENKSKTI